MSEWAAVWAEADTPEMFFTGQVVIENDLLRLVGRATGLPFAGLPFFREIPGNEIAGMHRTRAALRTAGRRCLCLRFQSGGDLLVSTIFGVGSLSDLSAAITTFAHL